MKKTALSAVASASAAAVIAIFAGCGVTSPDFSVDFPFYFLQDVSTSTIPMHCCYLNSGDDGIAATDSLFFIDYQQGYCVARVGLEGYTVEDVGATAEGGYAIALCGNLLFYVSDGTYVVHNPVSLGSYGRFLLTDPTGGSWHVYSVGTDGTITTVNTQSWDVVSVDTVPGLDEPVAAVISADGSAIFLADGSDDTVKRISTGNLGAVTAECVIPGGTADMYAGPGNLVYAAPDSLSQIWGIDTGTGLHYSTYYISSPALSVAVTPDDGYIYVAHQSSGLTVISAQNGEVEGSSSSYGTIYDMAVNGSGSRALICSNLDKIITLEK
ncbi:MAG: WD40 repeat domain-containing protein [Candidatus Fermentibacteraceae bacterium]|nr:WD40 repeat domain-containing protein [Candidatus Fermentibacteraceae bacterium]MBN2608094.1 WD40 repeat domain-containing protein [Candidatus Fermentibacteraceae bacterium]